MPSKMSKMCTSCGASQINDPEIKQRNGGDSQMLPCCECTRVYHPVCLNFTPNMIISTKKYDWQCIECKSRIQANKQKKYQFLTFFQSLRMRYMRKFWKRCKSMMNFSSKITYKLAVVVWLIFKRSAIGSTSFEIQDLYQARFTIRSRLPILKSPILSFPHFFIQFLKGQAAVLRRLWSWLPHVLLETTDDRSARWWLALWAMYITIRRATSLNNKLNSSSPRNPIEHVIYVFETFDRLLLITQLNSYFQIKSAYNSVTIINIRGLIYVFYYTGVMQRSFGIFHKQNPSTLL